MTSWIFPIALFPKNAAVVGEWDEIAGYLRLPKGLGPASRGAVAFWDDERLWEGTPPEVAQAIETVRQFVAQIPIEDVIMELQIRVAEDNLTIEYRYLKLSGEWSDWLVAGELLQGPEGVRGDRYVVYGERDDPNSFMILYRQLQAINEATQEYEDVGAPEQVGTLYDGWVHVGFYLPYMVDNEDGTMSLWRQWYCRDSAQENLFVPEGDPQHAGDVSLPVGPPGGYYLITSTNPAAHVAYFWREYYAYNPATQEYEASGVVEQIGGVVAPQGPQGIQGEKGDYYLLLADNPPESNNIVRLYRQRHSGVTNLPIDDPEQIGEAVAVQGPPGPVGPPGQSGGTSNWQPNEDYLNSTEWQRLSWIARKETEYVAASIEKVVRGADAALGMGLGVIAASGAFWGFAIAGPVGGLVGAITGIGVSLLGSFASGVSVLATEPYRTEEDIQVMAQELYCSLIPYRDFSEASLESWISQHETDDPKTLVLAGEHSQALQALLAQHWREIGFNSVYEEVAVILSRYEYDPYFDYTSLPCTPVIGDDQKIYDFTIDEQGWTVQPGGQGQYLPGIAWGSTNYNGAWNYITLQVDWGQPYTVTHWQILFDVPDSGSGQFVPYVDYISASGSHILNPPLEGTNLLWEENAPNGSHSANGMRVNIPCAVPTEAKLYRVSVTFEGEVPP